MKLIVPLVEARSRQEKAAEAAGETGEADTPDYAAFKADIRRKTGIDLNLYKAQQMRRRLTGLLGRADVATFTDYFALLERDKDEWNLFLDRMTINVSELFRNPEKWDDLRRPIMTEWLNSPGPSAKSSAQSGISPAAAPAARPFKAWSAGCSYGAEPYSLAILLDQMRPGERTILHATDLDRVILARAAQGRFTLPDTKNVAPEVLREYFTPLGNAGRAAMERASAETPGKTPGERADTPPAIIGEDSFQIRADIGRRVTFRPHNLLADAFEADYDLICCRNVVIYFTDAAKQTLYKRFHQALRVGGVLWVGSTERIFNFQELGFEMPLPFFYRRVR